MPEKFLTVGVSNTEYALIQERARDWGQSISTYVREKLGIEDSTTTALLNDFIERASKYPCDKTFPLRDLYTDTEWEALRSKKTHVGRRFYKLVSAGRVSGIEIKGYDENRTMTYSRSGEVILKSDEVSDIPRMAELEDTPRPADNMLRDSFLNACASAWDVIVSLNRT